MRHRRAFLWMGLLILLLILGIQNPAFSVNQYRVKKGDTLGKIAQQFGVSVKALKQANHLESDALRINQSLIIPVQKSKSAKKRQYAGTSGTMKGGVCFYTVQKGDTLVKISRETGTSVRELKTLNGLQSSRIQAGQKLVIAGAVPLERGVPPGGTVEGREVVPDSPDIDAETASFAEREWEEIERNLGEEGEFLGKWRNRKERQLLVKVALGFIGAPYRSGGDSLRGLDSPAFVQKIYEIFDVQLPRSALEQSRVGKRVDRVDLQQGDVVFFHGRQTGGIVGIYIGDNKFVHAAADGNREVRVSHLNEAHAERQFIKAVRLKYLDVGG